MDGINSAIIEALREISGDFNSNIKEVDFLALKVNVSYIDEVRREKGVLRKNKVGKFKNRIKVLK